MREKEKRSVSIYSQGSIYLSVNAVFEEIYNILSSIVSLFRLEFTEQEQSQYNKSSQKELFSKCPIKNIYLNQKLERVLLEKEDKRYPLLLSLFT